MLMNAGTLSVMDISDMDNLSAERFSVNRSNLEQAEDGRLQGISLEASEASRGGASGRRGCTPAALGSDDDFRKSIGFCGRRLRAGVEARLACRLLQTERGSSQDSEGEDDLQPPPKGEPNAAGR
ncbi:gll0685 [Gloeobacter violaceus PCC 7421]|uniref:Gll0685 protein n=2 Tax=Gloeobacter violaceus TaxID=33072 RepID=Q7NMT0_GLOVI|nr:gll0685 [Gloeobacter violaceus PCC 7421]